MPPAIERAADAVLAGRLADIVIRVVTLVGTPVLLASVTWLTTSIITLDKQGVQLRAELSALRVEREQGIRNFQRQIDALQQDAGKDRDAFSVMQREVAAQTATLTALRGQMDRVERLLTERLVAPGR